MNRYVLCYHLSLKSLYTIHLHPNIYLNQDTYLNLYSLSPTLSLSLSFSHSLSLSLVLIMLVVQLTVKKSLSLSQSYL
jgi:hypothetical protein